MKNISNKGFVLAETLVVAVFLMTIFSLIYKYFYPLMGEYEKREVYDSVDDKYSVYWLKRMIEDSSYEIKYDEKGTKKRQNFDDYGYVRFECDDITEDPDKARTCRTLVRSLQVKGCDKRGNGCDIFITRYTIGKGSSTPDSNVAIFKEKVKENSERLRYQENCRENCSVANYINDVCSADAEEEPRKKCEEGAKIIANQEIFDSGFIDYLHALPDYTAGSSNNAKYRVIAVFHHTQDKNNYYSYSTIEVIR